MLQLNFDQHRFQSLNDLKRKFFNILQSNINEIRNKRKIIFDFTKCTFDFDVEFIALFDRNSLHYKSLYQESKDFSLFENLFYAIAVEEDNENITPIYDLVFIFNEAIFNGYPRFSFLRCAELHFKNTIFHKGALFRYLDVQYVLYEPRLLGADATFYHRKKADLAAGRLRGKELGQIVTFHYRHALEGSGLTFFIGVKFTKEAHFTDAMLDKVQFSHLSEETLSKCFFANSMIEDTKFYNCKFPVFPNIPTVLDKDGWFKDPLRILLLILISLFSIYFFKDFPLLIFLAAIPLNSFLFMPVMWIFSKIPVLNINRHLAIGDDIYISKKQRPNYARDNYHTIREIYRQLRVNFEKHGDYQTAGEFYYSQRYAELITFGSKFYPFFWQWNLFSIHHVVNGFGERWLRALGWSLMTWIVFAYISQPNIHFTSSKSTPEYFLNAYDDNSSESNTSHLTFNENNLTDEINQSADFMLLATTDYRDESSNYCCKTPKLIEEKNSTKRIFAFDNRFDYAFTEQYIPMLKDDYKTKLVYSLTKMVSPFVSEEKNWFTPRSENAHILGIIESILLWFFFGAFVLAVKNKIKR